MAFGVLAKDASGGAALRHFITLFNLYTGVQNRHDAPTVGLQLFQFRSQITKVFGAGGEDFVSVHVVDIEPQAIGGEGVFGKTGIQCVQILGAGVTPAALVVAERPQRRQRRGAHQALQALRDGCHAVTGNHIKRRYALVRAKPESRWRVLIVFAGEKPVGAGVHKHRAGVVDEDANPARAMAHQQIRHGCVLRVGLAVLDRVHGVVGPHVGIPELGALAGLFHAGGFFTLAKETHVSITRELHQPGAAADAHAGLCHAA